MKRDYCEEHDDLANTDQFAEGRVCHYWSHQVTLEREYGKDDSLTPCRMVPMRLIPDNAIVIDRQALAAALGDDSTMAATDAVLNVLQRSLLLGETP